MLNLIGLQRYPSEFKDNVSDNSYNDVYLSSKGGYSHFQNRSMSQQQTGKIFEMIY